MGIHAAIERKIKVLEVYEDSALLIYQLKGEWETRDPKLIDYRKLILELIKMFDDITSCYLPRDENQMADALATLASMIKVNKQEDTKPIWMSICEALAHCYNIEEEEKDDHPWYHDILRYMKSREYPNQEAKADEKRHDFGLEESKGRKWPFFNFSATMNGDRQPSQWPMAGVRKGGES
ncbi:uncharacterized protein LOC128285512 [Gossypium arboreum]|uniref:uncharacterized protein LOC128285512 n=1 Tax=Gossypium arboreum TaxID=29729 RepID=UPI0022F152EB|nr:uncharacterized protein LOC128285512 [Gossypium arboreum]